LVIRSTQDYRVVGIFTARAVSHLGLANNHKICDTRFGHGKEPKIFWSPLRGERVTL
jgi:hypothetical protein